MRRLSKEFYMASFAVSAVGVIFVFVAYVEIFYVLASAARTGNASPGPSHLAGSGTRLLLVIGLLGLIYGSVVMMVLLYRMWKSIQDGHTRTTPGKAVGFLFIPLFNLYWMFQAYWGFSKDYNSHLERKGLAVPKLPEGLFLAWNIIILFTWIPFLGVVAYWAVGFVLISKICDGVNALLPGAPAGEDARTIPGSLWDSIGSLSLYCVSGEFAHDTVAIPANGLYIGRDPTKANLVLGSHEISSVHARVWPEAGGSQVWVEDWNSLNGTYYQPGPRGEAPSSSGWVQLKGKIPLFPGARFRLGDNVAEFEIRPAGGMMDRLIA